MIFSSLVDMVGDGGAAVVAGALVGFLFGAAAQQSRFCLRAATIEVGRRIYGERLAVWLVAFATALTGVQMVILSGAFDPAGVRVLNMRGSLSGAAIGGALFGVGMVLARGCPSRLLVLSGQGNLRAVLSGLVFAVAAQASIAGVLSPLRNALAGLWTVEGPALDLAALGGAGRVTGFLVALLWIVPAVHLVRQSRIDPVRLAGAFAAGLAIILGWVVTFQLARASFDPLPLKSITFSGPSAHTLMLLLSPPERLFDFDIGMVFGVFGGAFAAAFLAGELKLEGFEGGASMRRYLLGAVLMGFGAMLAGGCAVGSVSNAVLLATIGWVALVAMWGSSMLADLLLDRGSAVPGPAPVTPAAVR
ncbi:MAG: YeeE/YedE family protein [Hyphomicrobiaceae bacterium]